MGHQGDRYQPTRDSESAKKKRRTCRWCGGDLIAEEFQLAGAWWAEPRCLQCGRVPIEYHAVSRDLAQHLVQMRARRAAERAQANPAEPAGRGSDGSEPAAGRTEVAS
jgi:hypothetical protein